MSDIPRNMDECFDAISDMELPNMDKWLGYDETHAVVSEHNILGLFIRNNWGLWQNKDKPFWDNDNLKFWFESRGIFHPDDMSSIIILSYHRKMNGKDIKLEEQIEKCKEYYKKNNVM